MNFSFENRTVYQGVFLKIRSFILLLFSKSVQTNFMGSATDFPKLAADTILNRIDKQREFLHLSRNDVASVAGINQLSFINNFKKHKIPKFNDLYRISNALGITFDTLVAEKEPEYLTDTDNVIYWTTLTEKDTLPNSQLMQNSDKNAIVRAFNSLSEGLDAGNLIRNPETAGTSDEYRFCIFYEFLRAEEVDGLFLMSEIIHVLNKAFGVEDFQISTFSLQMAFYEMANSLWLHSYLPVASIWQTIDDKISSRYDFKSNFYKDSGISSRSYSEYQDATTTMASPSTDTMLKILKLLDIDNVDEAIRSRIPETFDTPLLSNISFYVNYEPMTNETLKATLKTVPSLAQFMNGIFSLGFKDLARIKNLTDTAVRNPYSNFNSDRSIATRTSD